jgi:uncharacterized protein (DUF433 family)
MFFFNNLGHIALYKVLRYTKNIMSGALRTLKEYQWIVVDKDLLAGQPTVKGTRLSVSHILACLSEGMTPQEIADDYPGFPTESISDILKFASEQVAKAGPYAAA